MDALYHTLKQYGKVKSNEPLAKHTTFKIGGPAKYFIIVDNTDKVVELLTWLDGEGQPYTIVGGGSNMLASDDGFDGIVIHIADKNLHVSGTYITAAAGVLTASLSQASIKASLTGFEWGVGVPGTIGGAIRGNAGATGGEMKDVVHTVQVYGNGDVSTYTNSDCQFGYRHSIFKQSGHVILSATIALQEGKDSEGIKRAMEYITYRNKTQPKGFASTGCIFKNVEVSTIHLSDDIARQIPDQFIQEKKISAGWLVEQVGMKGKSVGKAKVSEQHGNFIVNMGQASSSDVQALIEMVKSAVFQKYGIVLEEEIHHL